MRSTPMTRARFSVIRPRRPTAARPSSLSERRGDVVGIDADGEGVGGDGAVEDAERAVLVRNGAALFDEIATEVRGVAVGLEADEVEGAEAAGQALVLGEGGEDLRCREGDVQEEAHLPVPARGAQLLAHQQEVVVVHPDDVVRPGQLGEEPAEAAVDPLVGLELGVVEVSEIDAIVEDRPEGAVGVAEIIARRIRPR